MGKCYVCHTILIYTKARPLCVPENRGASNCCTLENNYLINPHRSNCSLRTTACQRHQSIQTNVCRLNSISTNVVINNALDYLIFHQLSDGLEVLLVSVLGPVLLCEWQLHPWQEAFITTVSPSSF